MVRIFSLIQLAKANYKSPKHKHILRPRINHFLFFPDELLLWSNCTLAHFVVAALLFMTYQNYNFNWKDYSGKGWDYISGIKEINLKFVICTKKCENKNNIHKNMKSSKVECRTAHLKTLITQVESTHAKKSQFLKQSYQTRTQYCLFPSTFSEIRVRSSSRQITS